MAMTELDAVNLMLAAVGEAPVNTLNTPGLIDASIAQTMLSNVNSEVQSRGWWFNKETEYPLTADVNDNILLPANTLHIDTSRRSAEYDVVQRNDRLYDRKEHKDTFPTGITLYCDVVFLFPFDELPHIAQWYITVRAARIFQSTYLGSDTLHRFRAEHENEAKSYLLQAENDAEDVNILNDSLTQSTVYRHFNAPR